MSVGIVTFAGAVTTALAPSKDRKAALAVVNGLALSKGTLLHDGVIQAVDVLGDEGQRSLLVLSDGADTSQTPIEAATTAIQDAGVLTDVVALEQSGAALEALQQLATAGQGQVISSDPAALQAAFAAEADILARQVLVDATLPDGFDKTEATIKITLPTSTGSVTAEAFSPVEAAPSSSTPAPVRPSGSWSPPSWALYVGPGGPGARTDPADGAAGPAAHRQDQRRGPRLQVHRSRRPAVATRAARSWTPTSPSPRRRRPPPACSVATRTSTRGSATGCRARAASSSPPSGSSCTAGSSSSPAWSGLLLGGGNLLIGFIFLAAGLFLPWMYLGFRRSRRRKAFNSGLPDTLQLISGSLAAGLSLPQSIDTIVREGSEPISGEFRRVLVETRLGVTLEDALEGVAERFDSKDFEWVVMAIKIQRQVGGNLAELLDTVAATMREREYVRRQVAALAAEGKLSAWVLGGLPPLFMLYLLLTNYDYVIVMFREPLGWLMLFGAATILAVGVFWMSRLVKVEV